MNDEETIALQITLPKWVIDMAPPGQIVPTIEERMKLTIALSAENQRRGDGGPFGALICDAETGEIIAPGVNRVVPCCASIGHAEIVAWSFAQRRLKTFDLGPQGGRKLDIFMSGEFCVQCWAGSFWTGLSTAYIAATCADIETYAGFKEGPKPPNWVELLESWNPQLQVVQGVLRNEALAPLKAFGQSSALKYNAGSTSATG